MPSCSSWHLPSPSLTASPAIRVGRAFLRLAMKNHAAELICDAPVTHVGLLEKNRVCKGHDRIVVRHLPSHDRDKHIVFMGEL
mmetsp:Transcript_34885/g.91308  ORF Transcript_34885/g.91308 Transcript_34885/m.91308 type:complete len:83 (-) Transcript_34885:365-613(-)